MKSLFSRKIYTLLLCSFVLLFLSNITYAEQKIIEVEGIYADSAQNGLEKFLAQKKAKQDALRNAIEQAGVFVNSVSISNNLVLTSDEIETVTAGNVKVLNESYDNHFEDNGETAAYTCKIKVLVDVDLNKLQNILEYRKKDKISPFVFIADDLEQIYKNKAGKSVWISPKSILYLDGVTNFIVALMSDTTDECIVFEGQMKAVEKLYRINDAKIYNAKTGKYINSFPTPLYKWQPYTRESLYGSIEFYIYQRNAKIANDIILNNYNLTKKHALGFLTHHMKTKENLYYQSTVYTRFSPGIDGITVTYFIPDTIEKIDNNIARFKTITVHYDSPNNVVKSLKLSEVDCTQYDIESWELNKAEKKVNLKHYSRYKPSHELIREGYESHFILFVEDPRSDEPIMFHSLKNFYDKYIK